MMDRYLRKVIESELDSALAAASDRFAALLKNRKKSWGPARFEIASVGSRRILCGLSFDPRLDIFCPVLDWLTPEAKSSPHWYWYGHSRNTSQIWSEAPEHDFGSIKLECPTGGYNVNISAVTRDSEEYRTWWTRMTKHPTWQEIMAPRARLYTRHAAQTICEIGLPLADDLARLFEQR